MLCLGSVNLLATPTVLAYVIRRLHGGIPSLGVTIYLPFFTLAVAIKTRNRVLRVQYGPVAHTRGL